MVMIQVFFTTASQMLKLVIFILIGYVLCKRKILNDEMIHGIMALVLKCCVPIMIFSSLQMDYSAAVLIRGGIVIVLYLLSAAVAYVLAVFLQRKMRLPPRAGADWRFDALFSNVGFVGLPVVMALSKGGEAMFYACCVIITNNVFFGSVGENLYRRFGGYAAKKVQLKSALTEPIMIAMALGLFCFFLRIKMPNIIMECCDAISAMVSPFIMFSLGALLTKGRLAETFIGRSYYVMILIRMIAAPLVVWALGYFLTADRTVLSVVMLMCAMPGPAAAPPLALKYGDPVWATRYVIVSTVLSMITLPVFYLLTQMW